MSDDEFVFSGQLPVDDDEFIMSGGPGGADAPQPSLGGRGARYARVISGNFWGVMFGGVRNEATLRWQALGLVRFRWELKVSGDGANYADGDAGILVYTAERTWMFECPVPLPDGFDPDASFAVLRALGACSSSRVKNEDISAQDLLSREHATCDAAITCSPAEELLLAREQRGPFVFRSIRVSQRHIGRGVVANFPSKPTLRRWRRDCSGGLTISAADSGGDDIRATEELLFLPSRLDNDDLDRASRPVKGIRPDIDPIRCINAIAFARHLRSPRYFKEAIDDVSAYMDMDSPEPRQDPVDHSKDPKRSALMRSLARADAVGMLLTRRQFRQWRKDDVIAAINLYSDASPVVGVELQGMLCDILFKDGTTLRMILPGSTLAYGHTDTISKAVALVWAIWLVAGPTLEDLRFFCDHVRSLTTDFGVEMHLIELPDISAAFVAWAGGTALHQVRPLVVHDRRIFRFALRIAGWSHTLGGIMKTVAESAPEWPRVLAHLRSLCKFFRNESYRRHIARRLKGTLPGLDQLLRYFTAGFAKWRYETIDTVLHQVLALRQLCQHHLTPALFAHAQDQELVRSVMEACRDSFFWKWAAVAHQLLFRPLELLRRWGMVCECPDHVAARTQDRVKHIYCGRTPHHDHKTNTERHRDIDI